jgi:predicted nucleotidyltransferase
MKFLFVDLSIQLDLLVVVERSTTIVDLRRQLEEQLAQQLDLLENNQINVSFCFFIIEVLLRVQLK